KFNITARTLWCRVIVGLALIIGLAAGPAMGAGNMDPDADQILKSMSSYLGGTKAFSMNADIDCEFIAGNGQKLQLSSFASIVVERPQKFFITRQGMFADVELLFDGKTLTLYGKGLNAYAQVDIPGTIDDAVIAYEMEIGIPAPGADLLFTDPYTILSSGVESSAHMGTAYINGVECYHLAFRKAEVDWQLWVKTGDQPLPMKYIITTKWLTGAPQFEIRLRDWNTNPVIKTDRFTFLVPEGAVKLDTIPVNEMGEFEQPQEGK
ncbi:MAG: DUF2092 domain-containing protein, partial [Desulfobacter sp.]|nr:DUF2092 domain-containing protein [Desulfobacter sp.]